jgi:hypothetical protein
MDRRLITILRAAHCRSTHHFFVIDALPLIKTDQGGRLSSQLLKHYDRYLSGAIAPDTEFRDFRNHVVHINDNHWGGAPKAARQWYEHLIAEIRQARWSDAAYCAGVLSHYFTDPLMPLHTAQSEKQSVVHRPLEWSVTKSYDKILERYRQGGHKVVFETASDDGWLGSAVTRGAELSNRHYHELIERYDLEVGARRPEQGLDETSIDMLAGLFGVAITGWARIIERAADESKVEIPAASLGLATLAASITMPVAWILRRISSVAEQNAVRAIFDEFQATGQVREYLPPEVRSVRTERERDRRLDETDALASQSASALHQRIEQSAATNAGKSALRGSCVPTRDDVAESISGAPDCSARRSA